MATNLYLMQRFRTRIGECSPDPIGPIGRNRETLFHVLFSRSVSEVVIAEQYGFRVVQPRDIEGVNKAGSGGIITIAPSEGNEIQLFDFFSFFNAGFNCNHNFT